MLIEAFPGADGGLGYTKRPRGSDSTLIEERAQVDWRKMLGDFYGRFSELARARPRGTSMHAKRGDPVRQAFACPSCGATTCYRFGKNGRFLSCTAYPDCDYAAPVDREGPPPAAGDRSTSSAPRTVRR